jgi:hypothetical protein
VTPATAAYLEACKRLDGGLTTSMPGLGRWSECSAQCQQDINDDETSRGTEQ